MYLSKEAIKWAIEQLRTLPKDQLALFFFLAIAKEGKVSRGTTGNPSPFEKEILRYLGDGQSGKRGVIRCCGSKLRGTG